MMIAFMMLALAQGPAEPKISLDRLKEIVRDARTKHKVPGMAAAVVTGKGVHAMTWLGVRKAGLTVGVEADDRWNIGSDTKAFTSTLLAVLAEKGRLDLDEPLAKALPMLAGAMRADYRDCTLDMALRHRAGLPHDLPAVGALGGPRAERLAALRKGLALKPAAKPGERFVYSNIGYVAAAAAAERAGDAAFEKLLEAEVLTPLGIKDFGFGAPGTGGKVDQPWGHDKRGKAVDPGLPGSDDPPALGGATRLNLSLKDWARFIQDQLAGARGKGKLLKLEGYKRLQTVEEGETYARGGWVVEKSDGFPVLTHTGSNGGTCAAALLMPTLDVGVLVVCNHGPKPGEAANKDVMLAAARAALTGK